MPFKHHNCFQQQCLALNNSLVCKFNIYNISIFPQHSDIDHVCGINSTWKLNPTSWVFFFYEIFKNWSNSQMARLYFFGTKFCWTMAFLNTTKWGKLFLQFRNSRCTIYTYVHSSCEDSGRQIENCTTSWIRKTCTLFHKFCWKK